MTSTADLINLSWPSDSLSICHLVKLKKSIFKIILKTKNETDLLDKWLQHHLSIAGDGNVIVFDNGSTDERTLNIYKNYRDRIHLFNLKINHNLIHNTEIFSLLYGAIQQSSKFYTFIDADEFLYFTDGFTVASDNDFLGMLDEAPDDINFFGFWALNVPGNKNIFYLNDISSRYSSCLKGGKPIISSVYNVKGFINHNVQFHSNNPSLKITGGLLVCHLNMVDKNRRIMINREKILAHKFLRTNEDIDSLILSRDFSLIEGPFLTYIKEIVKCTEENWLPMDSPAKGCFQMNEDRLFIFGDDVTRLKMRNISADCVSFWANL